MIPTKDKGIYLLPLTDGGITQLFNMPNHAGYDKTKATHNGLDIGWTTKQDTNILACADGTVVDVFVNNSTMGHGVVLQHDFEDNTHSWTGYIHLKNPVTLKKGDKVKRGDVLGVRGGSPYGAYKTVDGKKVWYWVKNSTTNPRYGVHLHLYVTKAVTTAYTWAKAKENVIDPLPHLYRSKAITYNKLVKTKYGDISTLPYIEDVIPEVVPPVERDESVNQLLEKSDHLRVRMKPSLQGTVIGYLMPNAYYNYYEVVTADGYEWYQIAEDQWCAKTSTMTIFPAETETDRLKEQIARLESENLALAAKVDALKLDVGDLTTANDLLLQKIASIKQIIMSD